VRWWSRQEDRSQKTEVRRLAAVLFLAAVTLRAAGPQDFGIAELNAAIAARDFKIKPKFMAELDLNAPETYRIETYQAGGAHITGGDLRGLMYGLLEAASQMRTTGKLKQTHGVPALMLRGVRLAAEPAADWFASEMFWRGFFEDMARDRLNRLQLTFDAAPQDRELSTLRMIAETAAQDGVDVAVGLGAVSPAAVARLLAHCPLVKTVILNVSDPMADSRALLDVLRDAGRRVVLESKVGEMASSLAESAAPVALPLRRFAVYGGSTLNPEPLDLYFRMDGSQDAAELDSLSGAGFEIAVPRGAEGRPSVESIAAWGLRGYGPRPGVPEK